MADTFFQKLFHSIYFIVPSLKSLNLLIQDNIVKSSHWFEYVLPRLPDKEFTLKMRTGRRTLENLYISLQAYYPFAIEKVQGSGGHNGTPFLKILCAVLYKLGRVTTFRDVADLFGICKTSIIDKFPIVVRMIIEVIGPVFLKWPSINRRSAICCEERHGWGCGLHRWFSYSS